MSGTDIPHRKHVGGLFRAHYHLALRTAASVSER